MKNKMMEKAFPLLPKTNLSFLGRPQILGSNKGPLIGWNFYAKTKTIWTNRKVQFSVSSGNHIFPTKLALFPSTGKTKSVPISEADFSIMLLSCANVG